MQSDKEKSETYKYFYKMFKSPCRKGEGIGYITDKQCVVLQKTHLHKELQKDHRELLLYITKKIADMEERYDERNCIVWFTKLSVDIELPDNINHDISYLQYKFIKDILDAYEDAKEVNPDIESRRPISLQARTLPDIKGVREVKEAIKERINNNFRPRKENIYEVRWNDGYEFVEATDKEAKKESILYSISLEEETNLGEIYSKLYHNKNRHFTDPFYYDALIELFPKYRQMGDFLEFASRIPQIFDAKISGVTKDNLFEKLVTSLGHSLFENPTSIKESFETFHEGLLKLYGLDKYNVYDRYRGYYYNIPPEKLKMIEQVYPNFSILRTILRDSDVVSKIRDEDFKGKSGYDEVSKEVINIAYREKQAEIRKLQEEQKELEREEAFQKLYPQKVVINEEISSVEQEQEMIIQEISRLSSENTNNELIAYPESRTIFQKLFNMVNSIINRSKMEKSKESISSNTKRIEELRNSQKENERRIDEFRRRAFQLDLDFSRISKDGSSIEQYKSKREAKLQGKEGVESSQNVDRKDEIQKKIQELSSAIKRKESEIQVLKGTGLIDAEQDRVDGTYEGATHEDE